MNGMIEFRRPDARIGSGFLAARMCGLRPHHCCTRMEVAGRLAAAGFTVLAPDLYRGRLVSDADEASHMDGLDFVDATDRNLADTRPEVNDPASAAKARERTLEFFDRTLRAA
jgi:carboxymethylenebutenolidase